MKIVVISSPSANAGPQAGHAISSLEAIPLQISRSENSTSAGVQDSSPAARTDKLAEFGGLVAMPLLMVLALGFVFAISGIAACFVLADGRTRFPQDRFAALVALANLLGLLALVGAIVR